MNYLSISYFDLDQQKMIEELKYNQDQHVLYNQIANLEVLKAQQVKKKLLFTNFYTELTFDLDIIKSELEDKQRKQLATDRRHATALIQAHNRGELQKQLNTSRFEYVEIIFF